MTSLTQRQLKQILAHHPATAACPEPECEWCARRDCPGSDPLHYHHDGCPFCSQYQVVIYDAIADVGCHDDNWMGIATENVIRKLHEKGLLNAGKEEVSEGRS